MIYRKAILVILGLLPPFGTAVALEIIGKETPGSITLGTPDLPGSFSGPEKKRVFEIILYKVDIYLIKIFFI